MNTSHPQQPALLARIEQCYRLAESRLARPFARPEVLLTLRGQSAGVAHPLQNRLRFNPVLLSENPEPFLTEVVPHEIAHLLAHTLYGRVRPHGREWQALMTNVFEQPARTRHAFDVSSVAPKTFPYRCLCQRHALTLRRHNRVQRGQAQYHCRRCQGPLTPTE
ncbi:SprT family zinc-dependent metalloprotease [Ferrimonas gelatinilytica]|uniref:Protein SprT n=1 Tax=Ferrimonas gelatinilytica TaxID=1255257 RepID=A0ABP9SF47_9GAMM